MNIGKVSEAQRRASAKYMKEKCDRLSCTIPKGHRPIWEKAASAAGLSLSRWTITRLDAAAAVELDGQPEPDEKETEAGSQDHADGQPDSPEA